MMKPSPNAAPIKPRPLARFCASVTSEMYACATVMLPPVRPASMRDRNMTPRMVAFVSAVICSVDAFCRGSDASQRPSGSAKPRIKNPSAVPAMLIISTGRRP